MSRFIGILFYAIFSLMVYGQREADSLIHAFNSAGNDSLKIDAAIRLYDVMNDKYPDSLYSYLKNARVLASKSGYSEHAVRILILEGRVYVRLSDFLNAQKLFLQAERLLDSIKGSIADSSYLNQKIAVTNNLAIVKLRTGKPEEAKAYYLDAISYLDEASEEGMTPMTKEMLTITNHNLGGVFLQTEDYELAESYFLKAMSYLDPNDRKGMSSILNNLGIIEKDRANFEKSLDYLTRAIQIRRELGNLEGLAQSLNNLGNLLDRMGKTRDALDTLKKAIQLEEENKLLRSETITLESLSDIYARLGDYENAYKTRLQYIQKYDSLMNQENLQAITRLEMQRRFEKKMNEENLLREHEDLIRQRKETIYFFGMLSAALLLALLFMLYALQRSKLRRQRLTAEKDGLKRKSLELENEKLALDLEYKNKELTTNVIYLARTNEFISTLTDKLVKSRMKFNKENQRLIDEMIWELQNFSDRDTWKEFEIRFQEVQTDFYNKLIERFPDLSTNEKKLCAFLRLNMTTKEIAAITYQSVNSITVARSRLRKKLGIDKDENLISFLEHL